MRKGKIPYNSLIRSVLRVPFRQKETNVLRQDGAFFGDGKISGITTTLNFGGADAEALVFYQALNKALASGILPTGVLISLTLPESETEPQVNARMKALKALADQENVQILGGHTLFSSGVNRPVFTLTVSGPEVRKNQQKLKPGTKILFTKFAGDAGASVIAKENPEVLRSRFSEGFITNAYLPQKMLSVRPEIDALREMDCSFMNVSEGGIFDALYTLSEAYQTGFRVDIKKILMHQETIEFLEVLEKDPYFLYSVGSLIILTQEPEQVLEALKEAGTPCMQIGEIVAGKQKVIIKGEEERFLERPEQDPIYTLENFG